MAKKKKLRLKKEVKEFIKEFLITSTVAVIGAALMVGLFFGAALQESYKLCPVTEEEMAETEVYSLSGGSHGYGN